jgi:hypothetical protein
VAVRPSPHAVNNDAASRSIGNRRLCRQEITLQQQPTPAEPAFETSLLANRVLRYVRYRVRAAACVVGAKLSGTQDRGIACDVHR